MKIRSGFVSNSSSSSFIVMGKGRLSLPEKNSDTLVVPDDFGGETEFGWEPKDYFDFGSKLNFAYLQTQNGQEELEPLLDLALKVTNKSNNFRLELLEKVLKESMHVTEFIWNLTDDYDSEDKTYGYIDHASAAGEGQNLEMFESEEEMRKFLFCNDSKIHTDNDNH